MSDLSGIQYEYLPLGHDFSRPRTIGPVSIERLKQFAEVASLHNNVGSLPTRKPTIVLLTCLLFQLYTPGRINTFQILRQRLLSTKLCYQ